MEEVPCIYADDLTEEQIKAFRLADNKVSEKSMWDFDKLDEELDNIINIDMSKFDFDINDDINIEIPDEEEETEKTTETKDKREHICPNCGMKFYE